VGWAYCREDSESSGGGRSMRLLVLTFYYPPDLCAGSFRTGALTSSLQKIMGPDDTVDIVTTYPNRYKDFSPDTELANVPDNITVYRVKLPAHSSGMSDQAMAYLWYALFVLKVVTFKKYDRVFATSSRLFTGFLGAVVSCIKRRPLYLDLRDIFVENMDEMLKGRIARSLLPVFRIVERFTVSRASYLNCVSAGFEPYYQPKFPRKIQYHTNGIDPEFLERTWTDTSDREKMVVTYAGNIGEGQGLHVLFPDLARAYPDIEFRIIGNGGKRKELEKNVEGISNVRLYPPVSREELIRFYDESDALLMHLNTLKSFERVLPSKVFEYGATGKVVLAGVSGYARKFVEENLPDAICFDPCNVNELKKKFAGQKTPLIDRSEFRKRFAREAIMDRLAWDLLQDDLQ
jgi:glycosyltransferase involved in cell wall biosynthesis